MALEPGSRLGPYEILSLIGAGGMGEVYKAKDTRLDRIVAIKVLPPHLSDNSERRERFGREARAVSSLNHPNICILHDIGEQDGTHFLVMEYIEGETLADRLAKGSLPLDQAFRCGIEIADALDKAHRQGVVHRDFKPGNVMLTKPGAKLLDFGLAKLKAAGAEQAESALSALPTEQKPLTKEGSILGTFQYMAPEQLEGKEADARTDIFAFGSVLYEMVTGKRAFEGKSQASLIAAILEHQPTPMTELQPVSPPALDRVVNKCLAKDPDDRWFSAHDLTDELKWISGSNTGADETAKKSRRGRLAGIVGLVAVAAMLIGIAIGNWLFPSSPRESLKHLSISVPSQDLQHFSLSRDGSRLAYTGVHDGVVKLHVRFLNQPDVLPMEGTEDARDPFFSPDGQWIGFFAGLELMKVPVSGGRPTPICDSGTPFFWGGDWGADDAIVFGSSSGLRRISAYGGTPQSVTPLSADGGERSHLDPEILPTGKSMLFTVWSAAIDTAKIAVASLETGEWRILFEGAEPQFSPSGHIIFRRGDSVLAVPFDLDRLEVAGASVPVLSGFGVGGDYALAGNGTLVYSEPANREMVWTDRQGRSAPVSPPVMGDHPRLSPSGRRVAVRIGTDIWIHDLDRGGSDRLTFEGNNVAPVWSPDGKQVAFSSENDIFLKPVDGSGKTERLLRRDMNPWVYSWSPNNFLAFRESHPATGYDIWVMPLETDVEPKPFLITPFNEEAPIFSPDGRLLAYVSDESGRYEVYVQPYPGPGRRWTISTDGGEAPVWSADGRELFYGRGQQLWAVALETEPEFQVGAPQLLFEGPYDLGSRSLHPHYDVAPDGRFIMLEQETERSHFNIILNWHQELLGKVPVK